MQVYFFPTMCQLYFSEGISEHGDRMHLNVDVTHVLRAKLPSQMTTCRSGRTAIGPGVSEYKEGNSIS